MNKEYINDKNKFQSEVLKCFKGFMDKHGITSFDIKIKGVYKRDKDGGIDKSEVIYGVTTDKD